MPVHTVKRIARDYCCPPAVWSAARSCYRHVKTFLGLPPPWRVIESLEELDAFLDRCRAAMGASFDDAVRMMESARFRPPSDLPEDPYSAAYIEAQMALWRRIAGRGEYAPDRDEQTPFDFEQALATPFPYNTRSCATVGDQLIGIGNLVRALGLAPGGTVLELGPGYGKLTTELVQMGYRVTAVDVSAPFTELVSRRCQMLGREVTAVCCGMLDYRPAERFDRVVFYESFHHCGDPPAMVARLGELVREGGEVIFAGEPIEDDFYCPWGLRLDGQSLWAIRLTGWLELGFRTDYFLDLLRRNGWRAERHASRDAPQYTVFVARRR